MVFHFTRKRLINSLFYLLVIFFLSTSDVLAINEPSAVTDLTAYGEHQQMKLTWTAPNDNGAAITDYIIEYKANSAGSWNTFADGTSTAASATVTSLTNGTLYDFRVSAVNSNGTGAVSNTATTAPLAILKQDNFDSLTDGSIDGQNGWAVSGGSWTVGTGDSGKIVSSGGSDVWTNYHITQGNLSWTNQRLKVDYLATASTNPIFSVRRTTKTGGEPAYIVFEAGDTWYLQKYINYGSEQIPYSSTASPVTLTNGNWFTVELEVVENASNQPVLRFWVYAQGGTRPVSPTLSYTDESESFKEGYVTMGNSVGATISFDNVIISGNSNENVTLVKPAHRVTGAPTTATLAINNPNNKAFYIPYIQTSTTLNVNASVGTSILPSGGGVKFTLNAGEATEQTSVDLSEPFMASFTGLAKGTYTVKAELVNSSQVVQIGAGYSDEVQQVGIGDIYIASGDSITQGYWGTNYGATHIRSWLDAPGGSTSNDNRNYPQGRGSFYQNGYLKELQNVLTNYYEYPIFIQNEGNSGTTSITYQNSGNISSNNTKNRLIPLQPNRMLLSLGTNDAGSVSPANFQTNMDAILDYVNANYGITYGGMYLAKPFYRNDGLAADQGNFRTVYDNLLGINPSPSKAGPNLYDYFSHYTSTFYDTTFANDGLHPNPAGVARLAQLWGVAIVSPKNLSVSQSGNSVELTWDDLSIISDVINGYKIMYGTSPGTYSTTTDVGDVTSATVNGLSSGQNYYFTVVGYYDDTHTENLSSNATEVALTFNTDAPSISNVLAAPGATSATITWTTNESASTRIEFGLSNTYGSFTTEVDTSPRVLSHSQNITGLATCATYNYRVISRDSVNNQGTGTNGTFTTTGCTGSSVVTGSSIVSVTTASGGTVSLLDSGYGLGLTVPTGFSGADASFQAHQLDKATVISTTGSPSQYQAIGEYIYEISALSGINTKISSFLEPITVTLSYNPSTLNSVDATTLKIFRWDGSSWHVLSGCTVDSSAHTVMCTTTAFSVFGLFGQTATSISSNTSSSTPSNTATASSCTSQPPGAKTPWLYAAVPQNGNEILLYFTEPDDPYDHVVLEYGYTTGPYRWAAENIGGNGARTYLVRWLQPNTDYRFRIRGGNGCATGNWSNEINAKTKGLIAFRQLQATDLRLDISDAPLVITPSSPISEDVQPSSDKSATETHDEFRTAHVSIVVRDLRGKNVEGATVTLLNHSRTTDASGTASFEQVKPGTYEIVLDYQGYLSTHTVNFSSSQDKVSVDITVDKKGVLVSTPVLLCGVAFVLLSLIVAGAYLILRNKRNT